MSNDEQVLVHHGVLGMKWGIRRYQNEDGSRTALGKQHYGYEDVKNRAKSIANKAKTVAQKIKKAIDETEGFEDEKTSNSKNKNNLTREQRRSVHSEALKEIEEEVVNDSDFMEKIFKMQEDGVPDYRIQQAYNREIDKRLNKRVKDSISMQMDEEFASAFDEFGSSGKDWVNDWFDKDD
mgnify:CR=1 FL=1